MAETKKDDAKLKRLFNKFNTAWRDDVTKNQVGYSRAMTTCFANPDWSVASTFRLMLDMQLDFQEMEDTFAEHARRNRLPFPKEEDLRPNILGIVLDGLIY